MTSRSRCESAAAVVGRLILPDRRGGRRHVVEEGTPPPRNSRLLSGNASRHRKTASVSDTSCHKLDPFASKLAMMDLLYCLVHDPLSEFLFSLSAANSDGRFSPMTSFIERMLASMNQVRQLLLASSATRGADCFSEQVQNLRDELSLWAQCAGRTLATLVDAPRLRVLNTRLHDIQTAFNERLDDFKSRRMESQDFVSAEIQSLQGEVRNAESRGEGVLGREMQELVHGQAEMVDMVRKVSNFQNSAESRYVEEVSIHQRETRVFETRAAEALAELRLAKGDAEVARSQSLLEHRCLEDGRAQYDNELRQHSRLHNVTMEAVQCELRDQCEELAHEKQETNSLTLQLAEVLGSMLTKEKSAFVGPSLSEDATAAPWNSWDAVSRTSPSISRRPPLVPIASFPVDYFPANPASSNSQDFAASVCRISTESTPFSGNFTDLKGVENGHFPRNQATEVASKVWTSSTKPWDLHPAEFLHHWRLSRNSTNTSSAD